MSKHQENLSEYVSCCSLTLRSTSSRFTWETTAGSSTPITSSTIPQHSYKKLTADTSHSNTWKIINSASKMVQPTVPTLPRTISPSGIWTARPRMKNGSLLVKTRVRIHTIDVELEVTAIHYCQHQTK
ncbi:hypothetical protein E2C01_028362 [Portunus trituberculatus]|uniref:Uncharacterized protein n=1 Tax=Portunus trituberculatus TaxID=210409 RepID=A0A5B7ENV8_PORTR|nr:hypothetical protein [Portunus trituberculatus]